MQRGNPIAPPRQESGNCPKERHVGAVCLTAHTRVVESPLLEGMALVRSFAGHRVDNDKRCDKRTALITAVLLWCNWQKAFTEGRHFTPRAGRVNPRQVSWLRAASGHSDRWWCDSSGIEKKFKEAFDSKMQTEVAVL